MESHLQSLIAYFSGHPQLALSAVFAAALLEALAVVGTVVPGSSIVFIGGVLIGLEALDPWWTAAAAVFGAILGDGVSYGLGRHYHQKILAAWPMRNHPELFKRGQAYFARNGGKSVFLARFLGPVRAIVPVVAGMSDMPAAQFYAANILSAFAWAGAHILPGVLFGASLQLAGAVSSRLVIMVILIAAFLWVVNKLVRFAYNQGWPRLKSLRDHVVERARGKSGVTARIALSLFDPARAESQALLIASVLLIGSAWLFLGVLEDVVSNDPLVQLDRTVYTLLQGVRTGWADSFMVAVTEVGGPVGTVTLIIAVSLLLALERCWRTLRYWLAAAGFAEILVWTLKYTLARARPTDIYTGVERYSFPSGHAALSIVVYGFMAFLLARGKRINEKIAITLLAVVAITLIAFSRLYLGVHWFSDVLGSLSLGLAWVALLCIAYTHHVQDERVPRLPLMLVVLTTLAAVGGFYFGDRHRADIERYAYRPKAETVLFGDWQANGWRSLPVARSELGGDLEEPFSVQWTGTAEQIAATLRAAGWQAPPHWASKGMFLWLLPRAHIDQLPVLPKFDHGDPPTLTFVKTIDARGRIVIRLWVLPEVVDGEGQSRPLWYGMVTIERLRHPIGMVTVVKTATDFATPSHLLEEDIRNQRLAVANRERRGLPVLLVW